MGALVVERILDLHRLIFERERGPWKAHLAGPGSDRGEWVLVPLHQLYRAIEAAIGERCAVATLSAYRDEFRRLLQPRALDIVALNAHRAEWTPTHGDTLIRPFSRMDPPGSGRYRARPDSDAQRLREIAAELERDVSETGAPSVEAAGSERSTNVFRREGKLWLVRFGGAEAHIPDMRGMSQLRYLLERPGEEIAAREVERLGAPVVVQTAEPDVVDDHEGLALLRKRRDDLREQVAELEGNDAIVPEDLLVERYTIEERLRENYGGGRELRKIAPEAGKAAYRRLKLNTYRAREALKERLPALEEHLETSLVVGSTCRYNPSPRIAWEP